MEAPHRSRHGSRPVGTRIHPEEVDDPGTRPARTCLAGLWTGEHRQQGAARHGSSRLKGNGPRLTVARWPVVVVVGVSTPAATRSTATSGRDGTPALPHCTLRQRQYQRVVPITIRVRCADALSSGLSGYRRRSSLGGNRSLRSSSS